MKYLNYDKKKPDFLKLGFYRRSLKYFVTPEGRAVKNGSTWDYEYNLKDHLGNTRVVIRKGSNGLAEVIQEQHYYPFGMEMSELSYGTGTNKYLYNSKEIQNDFDLYWYDYGARFYDPQLGRFHSVDPLAEDYNSWNPYHYVHNNPILLIDPTGMGATRYEDEEGKEIKTIDDGSNAVFQLTGGNRSNQYFKFKEYDESQGGKNEVNIQSVLGFTQDYTRENYTSTPIYKKDAEGNSEIERWQTYCNYATRCIGTSVASGLKEMGIEMDISVLQGTAKNIHDALGSKYQSLSLEVAQKAAKNGGFVVGGWSSHAFTLNKNGIINNVGPTRPTNNLWDPRYGLPKSTKFYQLYKPESTNR